MSFLIGLHPSHISKSAIAALTLPAAPAAIIRVVADGNMPPPSEECRENIVFRWLEADRAKAAYAETKANFAQMIMGGIDQGKLSQLV